MNASSRSWTYVRRTPLRADTEALFIPKSELPDARVGDRVVIVSDDGDADVSGRIDAAVDDPDVPAWRFRPS